MIVCAWEEKEVQRSFNGHLPVSPFTNWYLSNQVFGLSFDAQGALWRCLQKLWTPGCFWHCSPPDLVALGVSRNIEFHMDVGMSTWHFAFSRPFSFHRARRHIIVLWNPPHSLRIYFILLYSMRHIYLKALLCSRTESSECWQKMKSLF